MNNPKIVTIDTMLFFPEHVKKLQSLGNFIFYDKPSKNESETFERIKEAEIVINFWTAMPKKMLEQLPNLKMICVAATGYDWIDIQTAKQKNISVSNCPVYKESVAEFTIFLILDAIRHAYKAQKDIRGGIWNPEGYRGKELQGKTLGIVGYGRIGKRVAEIAEKGFNMNILHVGSQSSREELEDLLKKSDIISVNAPKNQSTEGLLGEKEFLLMKQDVVIVNTGRGPIIDEEVLAKNLESGKVFAAGLDVLSKEPMDNSEKIFSVENVSITPHTAWNTQEAEYDLSKTVVDNIEAFIKGQPINVVI